MSEHDQEQEPTEVEEPAEPVDLEEPDDPEPAADDDVPPPGDQEPPAEDEPDEQPEEETGDEHAPETLDVPLAALRPALEAVLMVADQPLDRATLATAVGYPVAEVVDALQALAAEYDEQDRGFDLRNVAGGWRYYTREDYAPIVERFALEGQSARLTQAALETLAVVAYRQPISRSRVSAVRGVNVDGVMRTLLTRGLVEEAGSDEDTGAHLYRTTGYFLERIGVTALDDLPDLAPFLPELEDMADDIADGRPALPELEVDDAPEPAAEAPDEPSDAPAEDR